LPISCLISDVGHGGYGNIQTYNPATPRSSKIAAPTTVAPRLAVPLASPPVAQPPVQAPVQRPVIPQISAQQPIIGVPIPITPQVRKSRKIKTLANLVYMIGGASPKQTKKIARNI
jgi:hypothetical protein